MSEKYRSFMIYEGKVLDHYYSKLIGNGLNINEEFTLPNENEVYIVKRKQINFTHQPFKLVRYEVDKLKDVNGNS